MKRQNVFSIQLLGIITILIVSFFSCTNNDTTDSSVASKMDTATTVNANPAMVTDTPMMSKNANSTTVNAPGMAKPDPSKKGKKGKVSIVPVMAPAANAKDAKMEADNSGVYSNVEIIPSFPGGYKGLQKFFDDNLEYPAQASNDGVEGTVNLSFVVDENGKLTSPKVEGDKLGYGLEEEALRVVNKMPVWNPGKLKGKNVKTKFTLPVKFVLY